jgi:hypothetical protein
MYKLVKGCGGFGNVAPRLTYRLVVRNTGKHVRKRYGEAGFWYCIGSRILGYTAPAVLSWYEHGCRRASNDDGSDYT